MQLREIGEIALKWLIPFILGGFTALAAGVWRDVRTLRDGVQCLLRAEIIRQSEKYTRRGRAPVYAKEALKRAYSAYHTSRWPTRKIWRQHRSPSSAKSPG